MINLRALEPNDVDLLYQIENDPDIWQYSATNMPFSRKFLSDYILSTTGDIYTDKQLRLVITDETNSPVGLIDLQNFDPKHLHAEVGLTIFKQYRNKGLATSALLELIDYASITLHLHQLYAITSSNNIASIRMLEKSNFVNQACLHEWLFDGKNYQDAFLFQRIL